MSWVFPGVCEVFASPLWKVRELMREDFPTLDRPMKANSGKRAGGQVLKSVLLVMKRAMSCDIGAKVGKKVDSRQ